MCCTQIVTGTNPFYVQSKAWVCGLCLPLVAGSNPILVSPLGVLCVVM